MLKKGQLLPKYPLISVQIKTIYNVLLGKKEDSQRKKRGQNCIFGNKVVNDTRG